MANINEVLQYARQRKCSDVHIGVKTGIVLRKDGQLKSYDQSYDDQTIEKMILSLCHDRILKLVQNHEDADFVYTDGSDRYRVNIYFQRGNVTAAIRVIDDHIRSLEELHLPDVLHKLSLLPRGLILVRGPTGSGKTYLVKTLARLLKVPLAITDATSLTEAGYIGDDVESVLSKLLQAADNDVDRAEHGIVFIDEIDKIAKKQNTNSRDVSGESVQQGLLKLLEGAEVEVPVGATSKNAMVPLTTINTRNILFICGGAFPNLEGIIKKRLMKKTSIGFGADLKDCFDEEENIIAQVTNEDLREYGFIPEFIGRLPMIFTLEGLTKEMLVKILKEPKNAILKQYQKILELDEVKLEFDEGALEAIAEQALKKKTGARALRAIIEKFMLDIMYEIPKDDTIGSVTITRDYIENHGNPEIHLRDQ